MNSEAGKQWLGHPRALSTLFFTEMWERFSYYGMRALLILYMVAPPQNGGLGMTTEGSTSIYGWYTFSVYALSIFGGLIADRWLGLYRSVFLGGVIIALGHFSMAFPSTQSFFAGLILIAIGTGLLKPNVSSMVGTLYDKGDARRDAGFSIYYMGINLGAFIAPIVCGWLGERVNWHYGFAAAGVGMTLGLVQLAWGRRPLITAEERAVREEAELAKVSGGSLTREEWKRIIVIGILFLFSIVFWMVYEQAGSSLNLFADRYSNRSVGSTEIPASVLQSIPALFVLILAPVFAGIWTALGKREPSSPAKFAIGLLVIGGGTLLLVPASQIAQSQGIKVSVGWLIAVYFFHTIAELCLSPVGLSVVTKLAPARIVGSMMGVWFLSLAFGNKAAGFAAGYFDRMPLSTLFTVVSAIPLAAGLILLATLRPIRRLMGDVK
jgi:proton-dependent oligopeptide transporter, POT family